jgi:hypothetical protein
LKQYDPDKQMFGSSVQTEVEVVSIRPLLKVAHWNLDFTVQSIKPFVKGTWTKPQLNSWESFWKV